MAHLDPQMDETLRAFTMQLGEWIRTALAESGREALVDDARRHRLAARMSDQVNSRIADLVERYIRVPIQMEVGAARLRGSMMERWRLRRLEKRTLERLDADLQRLTVGNAEIIRAALDECREGLLTSAVDQDVLASDVVDHAHMKIKEWICRYVEGLPIGEPEPGECISVDHGEPHQGTAEVQVLLPGKTGEPLAGPQGSDDAVDRQRKS